jgi:hypothetical protein
MEILLVLYDPGILYEFSIIGREGDIRPFLLERHKDNEKAYARLEELSRDPRYSDLKKGEEVVFFILYDA